MAIADVVGKIFSSQYVAGVKQVTPILSLANDRSAEIRQKGNGLVIPLTQGMVTVGDYPSSDDITYSKLSPTKAELDIDKKKYVAFEIEDIDDAELSFDAFAEGARQSGTELAGQLSADFRSKIGAATPQKTVSQEIVNTGDTKAQREQLVVDLLSVKADLLTLGYEAKPACLLHPSTWKRLMRYITVDKELTVSSVQETAFVDASLSGIFGMDFVVDWGATIDGTNENDNADSYFVIRGRTLTYAGQLSNVEQMRSSGRFATLWRALNTYGIAVQETRSLFKFEQTVAD